ncbi:hypothetical protein [Nocardioides sp. 1609]|uniref:hypothetical protein n=1 Tax=Nocardioides sp. 1609 TaxID=2508327 RepID=UPI0010701734|nr:hypothetical protein [Nocardioides sp. 1609]
MRIAPVLAATIGALLVGGPSGVPADAAAGARASSSVSAASAADDTRRCVTYREYDRIHRGWSRARVARVLDGPGRRAGTRERQYEFCGDAAGFVVLTFDRAYTRPRAVLAEKALAITAPGQA